ncbi:MAG: hypothetical protein ABIQ93_12735, partial [Saprospiraceae bacterium]
GAMGESKFDILRRIPPEVLPKMLFVSAGTLFESVLYDLQAGGLTFPLIAKPDVGERGFLVKKVSAPTELRQHLARYPVDFILQAFVDLPFEATVLYHFFPGESSRFRITSVCVKEFLQVVGDGGHSLRELILNNPRAAFQLERLEQESSVDLQSIPAAGEVLPLGAIGNHCLGTKFLNGNHLIDDRLIRVFEPLCRRTQGIYYGRFDLKSESVEALKNGRFQVMELNGVLGEPAHVYDPAMGAWRAYRDFHRHWRFIFEVSQANRRTGIPVATIGEGWAMLRQYFAYKKQLG